MRKINLLIILICFIIHSLISVGKENKETDYFSIGSLAELETFILNAEIIYKNNPNDEKAMFNYGRALAEKANILYFKYLQQNMYSRNKNDIDDLLSADRKLTKEQEQIMLDLGTKAKLIFENLLLKNISKTEYIYYHALSISMYAIGKSTFAIIMEGLIGKYNKSLQILADDYSPVRINSLKLIGRYYYVLPWPKGDLELSEQYLKEAVKLNPNALVNYLFLGDALW